MSAKRLIIKPQQGVIVNNIFIKFCVTPYKLLKSLNISHILSNTHTLFCFSGG